MDEQRFSQDAPGPGRQTGTLYLIPSPLGEGDPAGVLPPPVLERLATLQVFIVEEIRTARRFLSRAGLKGRIDTLEFHELNEHTRAEEVRALLPLLEQGDAGLISEAGLPAVADPGAALVALCHQHDIPVVPFVGPSSLMLALMASGLDGQHFAFRGYLPERTDERRAALLAAQQRSARQSESQLFIETPYRNDALLRDMLQTLAPDTRLCLAADLTLPEQWIRTRTVAAWKREAPVIGKRPCVFILLAGAEHASDKAAEKIRRPAGKGRGEKPRPGSRKRMGQPQEAAGRGRTDKNKS